MEEAPQTEEPKVDPMLNSLRMMEQAMAQARQYRMAQTLSDAIARIVALEKQMEDKTDAADSE